MPKCRIVFIVLLSFFIHSGFVLAKEFPVQARLFAGSATTDPKNLNETIETQGLKKVDKASQLGVEITYPILKFLDVGARYTKTFIYSDEEPSDTTTEYSASGDQSSVMLIARIPFIKSSLLRVDAFAGVGGSNTLLKVKTASQDGELTRQEAEGWFATPYSAYGASVAVGSKQFYFFVEGGYESNKVDGFARTGSVSTNINTLELSGAYVLVGLMFDGVPGSFK